MITPMQLIVSSMCFWQPYELLTDVPREALNFGYTWLENKAVPTYMARLGDSTMLRIVRGAGKYEACDINMKCHDNRASASMLVCRSNSSLLWHYYDPTVPLDHCVVFGSTDLGEIIYVSRQKVVLPRAAPVSTYNLLRGGTFTPTQGFSITEVYGPYPDDRFQLLCHKVYT